MCARTDDQREALRRHARLVLDTAFAGPLDAVGRAAFEARYREVVRGIEMRA
jgi:hypothetical protein